MLAEERFAMILDLLAQKRSATVLELCDALDASESTIRRDLTQLDRQGLLKKVHGGATLVGRTVLADEPPMAAREEGNLDSFIVGSVNDGIQCTLERNRATAILQHGRF